MKIIGAGYGRTGTTSLKKALEDLGFGPCYHMVEVIAHPSYVSFWNNVHEKKPVDWVGHFKAYQACVDFPACDYYRELMAAFPDAKVLLSVRDADSWYQSTLNAIYPLAFLVPRWEFYLLWPMTRFYKLVNEIIWEKLFHGRFEDRDYALSVYRQHIEDVKKIVPEEKLLVFDVKQGWEPLCRFLDVPVPDEAFPHLNDRNMMRMLIAIIRVLTVLVPVGLLALITWFVFWVF